MSKVIRFLEIMGSNSTLTWSSANEYPSAIDALAVEGIEREMLLAKDQVALSNLLGGRRKMQCMIMVPEEA